MLACLVRSVEVSMDAASVSADWNLSRKARNRLQHALNGNPALVGPGSKFGGRAEGKLLAESQPAAKLRALGCGVDIAGCDTGGVHAASV